MSDIKTVTLDGGELKVEGLNGQNTEIINKSSGAVYASKCPGVVPEADGVIEIAANTRDGLHGTNGTLYLLGTGKVELRGTDYSVNFRQPSSSTGGGGVGVHIDALQVASQDIIVPIGGVQIDE